MTIEEVKIQFGSYRPDMNRNDYIACYDCPLEECDCGACTGLDDCWEAIAAYMTAKEQKKGVAEKEDLYKENPYWEKICELADKQRSKGINKYGKGLEYNPADAIARINHLQEELIDGLMYCEWIKDKLMELEGEEHD